MPRSLQPVSPPPAANWAAYAEHAAPADEAASGIGTELQEVTNASRQVVWTDQQRADVESLAGWSALRATSTSAFLVEDTQVAQPFMGDDERTQRDRLYDALRGILDTPIGQRRNAVDQFRASDLYQRLAQRTEDGAEREARFRRLLVCHGPLKAEDRTTLHTGASSVGYRDCTEGRPRNPSSLRFGTDEEVITVATAGYNMGYNCAEQFN